MSAPDFQILKFEDWEILRCNGEIIAEGHTLDREGLLDMLGENFGFGVDVKSATFDGDVRYCESGGVLADLDIEEDFEDA